MNGKRIIEITADGSHTLFIPSLDEHYHSVNGAIQESMHVFIEAGFRQVDKEAITLFEVGFGTGLNALLTLAEVEKFRNKRVQYYTVEAFPLTVPEIQKLNYPSYIDSSIEELFVNLHLVEWNHLVNITERFSICKLQGDSNQIGIPSGIDLIYFDAFAPDKQPEMWNQDIFNRLYTSMNEEGVITTYCAKGVVRRMMQAAGFSMERIPGPPGKREMLRGRK